MDGSCLVETSKLSSLRILFPVKLRIQASSVSSVPVQSSSMQCDIGLNYQWLAQEGKSSYNSHRVRQSYVGLLFSKRLNIDMGATHLT